MISIRTIVVSLLTLAFAVFALPASADNKTFAIDASPSVAAGTAQKVTVKFTNLPSGNSSFNSISLTAGVTAGSLTITGATTDSGKNGTVTGLNTGAIQITGLSPTQVGKMLTVTLTVTSGPDGCNAGSVAWTADAWTGSPGVPSNFFALQATPGNRTTAIAGPGCKYSLSGLPASVAPTGMPNTYTVSLTNLAASAGPSITQLVLTPPAGLTVSLPNAQSGVSISGNVVTISRTVAAGGVATSTTSFALNVTAPLSCTGAPAASWSPMTVTPVAFALNGAVPTTSISAPSPACSMSISAPSSAAAGTGAAETFGVTVNLIGGPGNANVALSSDCSFTGAGTILASGSSALFSGTVPRPGNCTFSASADKGYGSATPLTGFKVYAGAVDCGPLNPAVIPPSGATFDASTVCGAASVIDSGYAAGFRGPNKSGTCQLVNASLTNNICSAVSQTDANGKTVPPKAVSFVWDTGFQPQAAFTYTLTWTPEYVDTNSGLPRTAWTKYCNGPGTTPCSSQVALKACIGTNVAFASIPSGEPACILEESWATAPPTDCASQTNPNAPNAPPACIRMSTTVIDALDPVMIRD
jgi:hypothetical protein